MNAGIILYFETAADKELLFFNASLDWNASHMTINNSGLPGAEMLFFYH